MPQQEFSQDHGSFREFGQISEKLTSQPHELTEDQFAELAELGRKLIERREQHASQKKPELEPIDSGNREADFDAAIRNAIRLADIEDPDLVETLQEQIESAHRLFEEIQDARPFGVLAEDDRISHKAFAVGYTFNGYSLHDNALILRSVDSRFEPLTEESLDVKELGKLDGFSIYQVTGVEGCVRDAVALAGDRVVVVHRASRGIPALRGSELSFFSGASVREDRTLEKLSVVSVPGNSFDLDVNQRAGLLAVASHEGMFTWSRASISLIDVGTDNNGVPKMAGRILLPSNYRVGGVKISRDGSTVAVAVSKNYGDRSVATIPVKEILSKGNGWLKGSIPIERYMQPGTKDYAGRFTDHYFDFSLSGDGKQVAAQFQGALHLSGAKATGTLYLQDSYSGRLSRATRGVDDLALNDDGSLLAVSTQGKLSIYSLEGGESGKPGKLIARREFGYPLEMRFSDNGSELQCLVREGVTSIRL